MVTILLGTGFEEAEALVPADLLRRAGVEVTLAGINGPQVSGAHNITVVADKAVEEIDPTEVELVMLPGGLGGVASIEGCPAALNLIRQVWSAGKYVAAICAAPTLLARMGLIQGRKAVCYPGLEDQLTQALPKPGNQAVADGNLITGEGPGAAFAFGLKLVEALKGPEVAAQIQNETHYR